MATIVIATPRTTRAFWSTAFAVLRAALGLVSCGLRNFGRPTCIDRRTGQVRPL